MAKLLQMSRLVDALLESMGSQRQTEEAIQVPVERARSFLDALRGRFGSITSAFSGQRRKVFKWLISRMEQVRERAGQLNNQIAQMSKSLLPLDDLLDIEIAQIQALRGKVRAMEVEVLNRRVAAMVVVPQLQDQLAKARGEVERYEGYLHRLETASRDAVGESVRKILAAESQVDLQAARAHLATLEGRAKVWRVRVPRCSTRA